MTCILSAWTTGREGNLKKCVFSIALFIFIGRKKNESERGIFKICTDGIRSG